MQMSWPLTYKMSSTKMLLTWTRWSNRVEPYPGTGFGAPNPWGVPKVSIPREMLTGSPFDRILKTQQSSEVWNYRNLGMCRPLVWAISAATATASRAEQQRRRLWLGCFFQLNEVPMNVAAFSRRHHITITSAATDAYTRSTSPGVGVASTVATKTILEKKKNNSRWREPI